MLAAGFTAGHLGPVWNFSLRGNGRGRQEGKEEGERDMSLRREGWFGMMLSPVQSHVGGSLWNETHRARFGGSRSLDPPYMIFNKARYFPAVVSGTGTNSLTSLPVAGSLSRMVPSEPPEAITVPWGW